jgi:flagellar biosynthesis/type III secretory pathway protein FliH
LEDFDHIPAILNEPIFQKAFETAELANMSSEQRDTYERSWLSYLEIKNVLDTARYEAGEEGFKKGIELGKEEGKQIGIELGKEEGAKEKQLSTIKAAVKEGLTNELISKIADVTVEDVQKIRKELEKNNL